MKEGIKRFITCHVPVSACNFKCKYCYIGQLKINNNKIEPFVIEPKLIRNRLSKEKLGGPCYFNLCGNGETMLHPQLIELVSELTKEGHFVDIITNGTISKKIDELLCTLDDKQQKHLFMKFSFHYDELCRTNLLEVFVDNVNKIKESNISYTIEITPYDDLIPRIQEIKDFSIKNFGALPHITVARNEATEDIELLTNLSRDEYKKIWSQFDSALFDFKFSVFNQKRNEFCYAGDWSIELDLGTGIYKQCYKGAILGNIKNEEPINFLACGRCNSPHCFNAHAFLAYGDIVELNAPTYCDERNRLTIDNKKWLKEECEQFFSTKLFDNNYELSDKGKLDCIKKTKELLRNQNLFGFFSKLKNKIINI